VEALPGAVPLLPEALCFELLVFTPGPVRQSLTNLESQDSSRLPILTPGLDGTPSQRSLPPPRSSPTQVIHTPWPPRSRITGVRHTPSHLSNAKQPILISTLPVRVHSPLTFCFSPMQCIRRGREPAFIIITMLQALQQWMQLLAIMQ